MDGVRNIHTYYNQVLLGVQPIGSVDTGSAYRWGMYSGDPVVMLEGSMMPWQDDGDDDNGNMGLVSFIRDSACEIWCEVGDGVFYLDRYVQVGFVYDGPHVEIAVDISDGYHDDGYYLLRATYPAMDTPPKVVWWVGNDEPYIPLEPEPEPEEGFWTNFRKCREIE